MEPRELASRMYRACLLLLTPSLACRPAGREERRVGKTVVLEDIGELATTSAPFACPEEVNTGVTGSWLGEASSRLFSDLYRVTRKEGGGNFLVSPHSIFTGLSMVLLGARGATAHAYSTLLHLDQLHGGQKQEKVHNGARRVLGLLTNLTRQSEGRLTVTSANHMFLDESQSVRREYRASLQCFYHTNVTTLGLQKSPAKSAATINSWIEDKTKGKIKQLVNSDSLHNADLVLVNTVYFQASWLVPFKKSTSKGEFLQESGSTVEVDMMVMEGWVAMGSLGPAQVVRLPYRTCSTCSTSDMAMFLFVPKDNSTLAEVEEAVLEEGVLSGAGIPLQREAVRLLMPKFEVRQKTDLTGALQQLGLPLQGDLGGLSGEGPQLGQVLHEAVLRVDEEGSEGAAATAVIMSRMLFIPRTTITVGRTFLLSIVLEPSSTVVFGARVDSP